MRNLGSYQLVSEHSILSAQMKNKVAAVEEFLEKKAQHSKPEWKEQLDTIKRRLERRRSRCDELTEKDFEIYLEMKLQWLQQYYVTAKSKAPDKKTREPEEDGWNEPDFKVYDRGRGKTENPNSRRRRSREDEFYEKLEEMAETLSSYLSNVAVKSSKSDKERSPELEAVNPETDGSERKKIEENRSSGSHDRSMDFVSENRSDDVGSGSAIGELSGTDAKPGKLEEEITSHDSTVTEGGAMKVEAMSALIDLGEISLSCVTVLCNREKKDEDEESSETMQRGESSPAAPLAGGTVTEVWSECEGDERSLSFVGKACDRNWGVNEARADWTSEKNWAQEFPRKADPDAFTVGQAQVTVSKSAQTLLFTPTQFIINEEVLQVKRKLDPVAISLGQTHNFIITPPIFTNSGGMLQVKREMGQKKEDLIFNSRADALVKTMDPPNTLLAAENKAFDPGDRFAVFGIAPSSCFKLWDPGGRLLTVCFCYLHLEDKVNV